MKALVVLAHPNADSYNRALAERACAGLRAAGHQPTLLDLYELGFRAAMSPDEHAAYHSGEPIIDPMVAEHVALLREAQILVFVYPTWWSTMPAMLKGWLERIMLPGVGFVFDEHGKVGPGLRHVRRIMGVSTYGSPHLYVWAVNDNGRRTITRALRLSSGLRARTSWLGLYAIDTATAEDRERFLARVERKARSL
ncbi:MAG: NAD(P)H-dependent oxidoreductase [Actinomycetota bacterium]|nr:NAD(P)H-dependent oxidoreductase [Actinomycetota bacterium]